MDLEDLLGFLMGPDPTPTPRPGSDVPVDEGGIRLTRGRSKSNPSSSRAERSRTSASKRTSGKRTARQEALKKLTGLIPASPTR